MVRSLEPLAGNFVAGNGQVAPSMAIIPSVKILSVRVVSSVYVAAFAPPTAAITDKASMDLVKVKEALQKPLFPSRIEQNRSVRFFFTTSKNGVFFAIKIV